MEKQAKWIALFDKASATASAIDDIEAAGVDDSEIVVMTGVPYPEGALGRHMEWLRLPIIVFAGAIVGFLFGIFLSVITPHLYRLDVGGHPSVGFAPAALVTFVFTMLATIIATFLGVIWEMNFPEFGPKYYDDQVTDGYLALLVEHDPDLDESVRKALELEGGQNIRRPEKKPL